jgi:hypothetical protein
MKKRRVRQATVIDGRPEVAEKSRSEERTSRNVNRRGYNAMLHYYT